MKTRSTLTISLLVVILVTGCALAGAPAPAEPESLPQPVEPQAELPVAPSPLPTATLLPVVVTEAPPTEAPTAVPQPIATSRGPNLEATDPATVSLASGDLQLVEFFRFTWSTCRAMAPMVHGLEAKYFGKVKFTYLDANDSSTQEFQRALGFYYQPEFYLLDGQGNLLQKLVGYVSEDQFESVFAQYLQ